MIANFKAELNAFEKLLVPGCRERILFFYGESGFGKTTLLQRCLDSLPEAFPLVEFQVRNSAVDVAEILSRTASCLGRADFPRYGSKIEAAQGSKIEIENVSLIGQHNQLTAMIRSDNPIDFNERKRQLLDAWFDDLANLGRMLLIVFDTYEHASAEVQNWIEGPFLFRVARMSTVRVLIAGRVVPDTQTIDWRRCCSAHHLQGIPDAEHWLPVVRSLNRRIPKTDEITWLDGLCRGLQGRPHAIMQFIESLPRRESPVEAGTDEERERLVLQIRLESLRPQEREALRAAAVPHWFDLPFLAALLNEPQESCRVRVESLARLSMVEPCPGRGYNVHERSRFLLLEAIEKEDPGRFLDLSRRAALHCEYRAAEDAMWHIERIFHLLIAEPALGLDAFREAARRWHGSTERSYDLLDALARMVRELRDAGRLNEQACGWSFYWDGRLDQIYYRDTAESHLTQAHARSGKDPQLDAASALALGPFYPPEEARSLYHGALEKFGQLDDKAGIANTHLALGSLVDQTSGLGEARPYYEKALAIYEQIGDREGRDDCLRRLDRFEKLDPPAQLFLSNLPLIEATASHICQRNQLKKEDAEDFMSVLKLKLIEDDYAAFRRYTGRSTIRTYLTVVIRNIFEDYKGQLPGKWKPSAEASRISRIAVEWEMLRVRDGFSFDEAFKILQTRHEEAPSQDELVALEARLWPRQPRRLVGEEELQLERQKEPDPDQQLLQKELQEHRERMLAALRSALNDLPAEDQLLLKMRAEGAKISEIARTLRMEQKPLYRRIERIQKELRLRLEKQGVSERQVGDLLDLMSAEGS